MVTPDVEKAKPNPESDQCLLHLVEKEILTERTRKTDF